MSLDYTFDLVSILSGFLPVLAALYNRKLLNRVLKTAAVFFLISCFFDPATWLAAKAGLKNNMPFFHLYNLISILFFSAIYYQLFISSFLKKLTLTLGGVTLLILLLYNSNIFEYPSVSNTALSIFLIILSLIYFYQLLNPQEFVHIEKQALFWINAGVLFYSAVNIFLFMLLDRIPKDDQHNYYMIHSVTNIIANILYSIGLLCKPQKRS